MTVITYGSLDLFYNVYPARLDLHDLPWLEYFFPIILFNQWRDYERASENR